MEYIKSGISDFNTDHIFDCGQCFRWERQADGSYTGTAMGKIVNMRFESEEKNACKAENVEVSGEKAVIGSKAVGTLIIDNCDEAEFEGIWRKYLDLDRNYGSIKAGFDGEEISRAADYGYGIRILRQEFWETLISFIISQNNNIPRIKGCIEALARNFGERIGEYRGKEYFALPEPEQLASLSPEELAVCRLGYRSPYLIETARQVLDMGGKTAVEESLLRCENFEEATEKLREFQGVGPKVASCVALFGLGFFNAFPIDVWMRRVMHRLYGIDENNVAAMREFAKENFAPYGGIAQQYLFYYIRSLED